MGTTHDLWSLIPHLAAVWTFLLAHGTSAGLAFAIRRERDPERMRRLLELSEASLKVLYPSILVLVAMGIVGGFRRGYWSFGWIWTGIGLLVVSIVVMSLISERYSRLRKTLGIRYRQGAKIYPGGETAGSQEIDAAARRLPPALPAAVGIVALAAFLYLMTAKPF